MLALASFETTFLMRFLIATVYMYVLAEIQMFVLMCHFHMLGRGILTVANMPFKY